MAPFYPLCWHSWAQRYPNRKVFVGASNVLTHKVAAVMLTLQLKEDALWETACYSWLSDIWRKSQCFQNERFPVWPPVSCVTQQMSTCAESSNECGLTRVVMGTMCLSQSLSLQFFLNHGDPPISSWCINCRYSMLSWSSSPFETLNLHMTKPNYIFWGKLHKTWRI